MRIDLGRLRLSPMLLKGFLRDTVQPLNAITLPILVGKGPFTATTMADFLVVNTSLSYNVILELSILNSLRAFTSTYHSKINLLMEIGVSNV